MIFFPQKDYVPIQDWETSINHLIKFVEYTGKTLEELEKRIEALEKRTEPANYISGRVAELREEIDKLKKEPRVINNYYTTTQQWPQPFPQPVWFDSVTTTTGKMEMKNGR